MRRALKPESSKCDLCTLVPIILNTNHPIPIQSIQFVIPDKIYAGDSNPYMVTNRLSTKLIVVV